jgi:hypothetical protein
VAGSLTSLPKRCYTIREQTSACGLNSASKPVFTCKGATGGR